MKKLADWWVPDREEVGIIDILNEWEEKHKNVLSYVKKKRKAIQAGGYVGVFSKGLSKYFEEVITFEPVKENWDCLVENIQEPNIRKFNSAIGDQNTALKIRKIIHNNCGAIQLESSSSGDIKLVRLDDLYFENIDLLWLDLEGYEVKALLGAKNLIKKYKPVIVLENNGLIHEFPSGKQGSENLRHWMKEKFSYSFKERLMRDEVFVYEGLF